MSNKQNKTQETKKKQKQSAALKKKKRTLAIVAALLFCAVVVIVLYLIGVIHFDKIESTVNNRTGVAYVSSSDADMIINSEGRVLEKAEAAPDDIPQLTGLELTKITEGEYLEYENADAFDYAVKLVMALRENDILMREININEQMEATAYVNRITVLFGPDDKTELKAADLADFFDQVKDLKGTLHMEEVNDKFGYTFKQETENNAVIQEATTAAEENEETDEDYDGGDENYEEVYYEDTYEEEPYYEEENEWVEEPVYEEEYYEGPSYEEPEYIEEENWDDDGQEWDENQEW